MSIRGQFCLFTLLLVLFISVSARGQEMMGQSAGRNVTEMKLTTIPPLPTCVRGSVESGDPSKGPSIIFARLTTGCTIPWHWHTPNEHVIVVSGVGRIEMKDGKPLTLRAGGFALLASHHVHQFHCKQACQLYIYSDVAFDIHYVNAQANEISPSEAMKAVGEKAATEMK
ncbi:MAG: cupin domain-containing protein [Pyrinomonadaceae bacterium]